MWTDALLPARADWEHLFPGGALLQIHPASAAGGSPMSEEEAVLGAVVSDPQAGFIAADWLEERGDARGEILRLVYTLTRGEEVADRAVLEERLRGLLGAG